MTLSPDSVDRIRIDDLLTPGIVRLAGAALVAAGFFVTATALALTVQFEGLLHGLAVAPVWALGLAALGVGPTLYNGRGWAGVVGVLLAPSAAILLAVWAVYAVVTFTFVPILALGLGSAGIAAVLGPFAVLPALRVSRARRALLD